MKILVINAFYPPLTTGSAHFANDMSRTFAEQGHEVLVVSSRPDGTPSEETIDGVRIRRLPSRWWSLGNVAFNYSLPSVFSFQNVKLLRNLIADFAPDVIHQHGQFFDLTLISSVIGSRRKIPRVLTVHTPLIHTNPLIRAVISVVDRGFLRRFVKLGQSRTVAVDRFTMDLCQKRYATKDHPIGFIPAAIRPESFGNGDSSRVLERFRLERKKVILSFGHVIPIRSRVPLIRALPGIIELVPEAHVLVVGQVYDWTFMRLAQELGVAEHITIVGRVPRVDVPDYLSVATIETHDLDSHGLGMTTFEVMAAGVPILAVVRNDVFPGVILSKWPKVRIRQELDDAELANEIVSLLRADETERQGILDEQLDFLTENFSLEVVAQKYLSLFEQVIEESLVAS